MAFTKRCMPLFAASVLPARRSKRGATVTWLADWLAGWLGGCLSQPVLCLND